MGYSKNLQYFNNLNHVVAYGFTSTETTNREKTMFIAIDHEGLHIGLGAAPIQ